MKGERKRKKEKKRTKSPTHAPFGILCSVPYCRVSSSPAAFNLPFYEGMNVITTSPNSNVLDVAVLPYLFFSGPFTIFSFNKGHVSLFIVLKLTMGF